MLRMLDRELRGDGVYYEVAAIVRQSKTLMSWIEYARAYKPLHDPWLVIYPSIYLS
jgi:hypothetical protein